MNQKRAYRSSSPKPEFLHEVDIESGSKTYRISKGTWLSVYRKPGLVGGKYELLYAERCKDGTLILTVEGLMTQPWDKRKRRTIRVSDIRTVHIKTRGAK